jgi:hypothetical protein
MLEADQRARALRRAYRIAAVVAASLLGLLFAEGVLRASLGRRYATIYRLDPECLHALIPGAVRDYARDEADGGARIIVSVNDDGFRGPPLRARDDGARAGPRVVVYGDSFVAAEFSSVADSYTGRLAAALGGDVEVVNAGVVAYGPDQVSVRLGRELPELAPDLVIVALSSANDHGDLVRNGLFRLADDGALAPGPVAVAAPLARAFERARHDPMLVKVFARAWQHLEHRDARERWRKIQREGGDRDPVARVLDERRAEHARWAAAGAGELEVTNIFGDGYDADIACDPDGRSARDKRRLMAGVLGRIRDTTRAAGVPLLFVVIPSPIDACDAHPAGAVDPADHPRYDRRALTRALADDAARLSVPCVDLFDAFRAAGAEDLYFRGDDHWNDAGQALAARLTAERIAAEGFLRLPGGR